MATLQSTLRLALIDTVTGPSRAITATLGKLSAAARRNGEAMNEMRGRVVDSVTMGYALARSLSAPLTAAAAFETQLEDIGQKANIPQERLAALGSQLRQVGRDTNQAGSDMAEAMDTLMGMGASESDALNLLPDIGKAATAYRASITDLSNAGFAALDNLKVPANEFGKALDAMASAGKAGAFELRDMSQYFPALGAGYQALGQTGVPAVADLAAALQIVRKGAGDSSEAANNLKNVLGKIKAPQTVKAFKGMGVNLEKELAKAAKRGLTPIEAIAEVTNKALKGDLSKIGDLFSDSQVQAGLRPLIQNMELYRQIRADAMKAQGVVQEDYDRRIRTGQGALLRMKATLEALSISIGSALLPALSNVIDAMAPIITKVAELAERYPNLTTAVVGTTAALIGLRIALTAFRFVGLFTQGGLIAATMGLTRLSGGLVALLNPLKVVRGALVALRVAMISTGVGALVVGLAAAGMWIANNWGGLSTMFSAFGTSFRRAIEPIATILQPAIDSMQWLYDGVSNLLGPVDGLGRSWFAMGSIAGKAVGDAVVATVQWMRALPGLIAGTDWSALGSTMLASFASIDWSGIGTRIVGSVRDAFARISDLLAPVQSMMQTALSGFDGSALVASVSRGLATIRTAIGGIDWAGIGKGMVSGIGAATSTVLSAIATVRDGLVSMLSAVDLSSLTAGISAGVAGLFDTIASAYRAVNWSGIGQAVGASLRAAVVGAFNIGAALAEGAAAIGVRLAASIATGFSGYDWSRIGVSIVGVVGAALAGLNGLVKGALDGLFSFDAVALGASLSSAMVSGIDAMASISWGSVGETIGSAIRTAIIAVLDIGGAIMAAWNSGSGGGGTMVAERLAAAIGSALTGFDWASVGSAMLRSLGTTLLAGTELINGILKGLFKVDLMAIGSDLIQSLWTGMIRKFDEVIAWFKEIPSRIRAAIGNIDLSSMISWPKLPSFLGGGSATPAAANGNASPTASNDNAVAPASKPTIAGARRSGGPVTAGKTYEVNEDGTELFTPDRSGVISPHDAYKAALAGAYGMPQSSGPVPSPTSSGGSSAVRPSVVVHLKMENQFTSPSDPYAASNLGQQTADAVRSAVESAYAD